MLRRQREVQRLLELGVGLVAPGVDPLGGLVFNRLGRLPRPDDRVEIEGHRLVVRRVARRRIEELLVEPVSGAGDRPGEEAA